MTNHQKRLSAPTSWPVERKTDTFTVKADAGPHGEDGVPLLILLRDVLGYVDTRSEANYALSHDAVLVNGQPVSDEERPIGMFDILAFTERDEFYRVFPDEGGRLSLTGIDEDAADSKLGKVVGKRQIAGGDTQLTLHDGETLLVDDVSEYDVGGSLVVDNDDGSIVAHFPFETGALVTAVDGSHAGEIGIVDEIQIMPGSSANTVTVETDDGSFETIEEYVVVIDENFTAGDTEEPDEAETADSDQAGEEQDDDSDEAADEDDAGADSTAEADDEAEDDGGDDE